MVAPDIEDDSCSFSPISGSPISRLPDAVAPRAVKENQLDPKTPIVSLQQAHRRSALTDCLDGIRHRLFQRNLLSVDVEAKCTQKEQQASPWIATPGEARLGSLGECPLDRVRLAPDVVLVHRFPDIIQAAWLTKKGLHASLERHHLGYVRITGAEVRVNCNDLGCLSHLLE